MNDQGNPLSSSSSIFGYTREGCSNEEWGNGESMAFDLLKDLVDEDF